MIKLLFYLILIGALAYCGATVKLGKRTFFGHVRAIWATEEVQDLKEGVKETAGPAAHELKQKVHELTSDDAPAQDAGAVDAVPAH